MGDRVLRDLRFIKGEKMFLALLETLSAGLTLWDHKEKTKYVDAVTELKRKWYEEYQKHKSIRDNAVLDNIELELRIVATAFAATVGNSKVRD
jgi:hypothetical protein